MMKDRDRDREREEHQSRCLKNALLSTFRVVHGLVPFHNHPIRAPSKKDTTPTYVNPRRTGRFPEFLRQHHASKGKGLPLREHAKCVACVCVCVVSAKSGKKNNSAEQEISLGSRQKCRSPRWTGSWGQIHPSRKLRKTAPIQTTPRFFRSLCLPVPRPSSRFFSPKEEQPPKKKKKQRALGIKGHGRLHMCQVKTLQGRLSKSLRP